ncbi:LURP-one-related family protein [bacterium]|nr:LURP-one-related family protein [bacterium]
MVYQIEEKLWSWADQFTIRDLDDRPVYYVHSKLFSWGHKLSFQDLKGNELAFIEQRKLSLLPRYRIYRDGKLFAEMTRQFTWLEKRFTLDVPGPNDYTIEGSPSDHEFIFTRAGQKVATVSQTYFSATQLYGVHIVDGEDDVSILCACIVIDQVIDDEKNE